MDIIKICGTLIAASVISLILKEQNNGIYRLISVAGILIAAVFAVNSITPILEYTAGLNGVTTEVLKTLVRALGISYLTDLASAVCTDMGETSLAMGVSLCGKAEILLLSLPMFGELIDLCIKLMN